MECDFATLENLLTAAGREDIDRLKEQDAEIEAASCTQPNIGRLVNSIYVPLLLAVLSLNNEEFDTEYPGCGEVSLEQRKALAEAIKKHCQACPRCSLKFSSEMEWDEHVDKVFSKCKRTVYA